MNSQRRTSEGPVAPTLTIGLPVFNGERYLEHSLDALLAQTFTDFELIISDNASTDGTAAICERYCEQDERIAYIRQPSNIGAGPNHNILVPEARGRYFKWASHDDFYAPELLRLCVKALEDRPDVILAHSWDALIDGQGRVTRTTPYQLDTDDPRPWVRLRSMLYTPGGNDFYGVIRTDVLRRVGPHGSYYNADRTFVAALCLQGPFYQVPEVLYFRRDHSERASRAGGRRERAAVLDPARADRLRNPMLKMYLEYVQGYLLAIARAPIRPCDRVRCLAAVGRWLLSCLRPGRNNKLMDGLEPMVAPEDDRRSKPSWA